MWEKQKDVFLTLKRTKVVFFDMWSNILNQNLQCSCTCSWKNRVEAGYTDIGCGCGIQRNPQKSQSPLGERGNSVTPASLRLNLMPLSHGALLSRKKVGEDGVGGGLFSCAARWLIRARQSRPPPHTAWEAAAGAFLCKKNPLTFWFSRGCLANFNEIAHAKGKGILDLRMY